MWKPLLSGAIADEARAAVRDIADALAAHETTEPSLAGGNAGRALLFHQSGDRRAAEEHLDRAIDALPMQPGLFGGFTGVAWVAAHIRPEPDPNREIDDELHARLERREIRDFDLMGGLVGIGVYALERGARRLVDAVVAQLGDGACWRTDPDRLPPAVRDQGQYNLGVAHGTPGVIAFLARAGITPRLWWLRAQERPDGFPAYVGQPAPARSGWCYGDPGIAAAMVPVDREWAVSIGRRAAERPDEDSGVVDAGLCHGAAGLGHLFNRLWQSTGDAAFARAARHWFERAMQFRRPGRGLGGFQSRKPAAGGALEWADDGSLLGGSTGIGLALLAAVSDVPPTWDRLFLMSC